MLLGERGGQRDEGLGPADSEKRAGLKHQVYQPGHRGVRLRRFRQKQLQREHREVRLTVPLYALLLTATINSLLTELFKDQ